MGKIKTLIFCFCGSPFPVVCCIAKFCLATKCGASLLNCRFAVRFTSVISLGQEIPEVHESCIVAGLAHTC